MNSEKNEENIKTFNEKAETPDTSTIEDVDDVSIKQHTENDLFRMTVSVCILVFISFILGYLQATFLTPFVLCAYALWTWKIQTGRIFKWFYHEHEMREHRKRALEQAETVEWFNYLINRWWVFSDTTIFHLLKREIDPVLQSTKPKLIESIELETFTLGNRTPYFKYLRVYDMCDDLRKLLASDITYRNPPKDLAVRPKYQVALDADMGLDAPDSKFTIQLKLNSMIGGVTDICIEKIQIRGRVQIVLHFNQNIPFPHLAKFSISFLHPPKVHFDIRLLKNIQLMEFPVIKSWIRELVNDALKVSLVDPGHLTIPLCNDPEVLGRLSGYASGVLTLTIKGNTDGKATDDTQWCSITLGKKKIRTKEINADILWQEQISLLVHSIPYDKLRIKIKGKRIFSPNYTIVEYILPLIRMKFDHEPEQEITLRNENIDGSTLQVVLNYSSLAVLDISNETDEETFTKNYIEKYEEKEPAEGVLFVRVHKGINLLPMDTTGASDPYVMIFANKELMKVGHIVEQNLNPEWDTMIEFFTLDYTQTTLSFIIHDHDPLLLPNVLYADEKDNDDFMGSCNLALSKKDWCVFKREIYVYLKFPGNSKGQQECMKKVGKIQVSVIFRPISSLKHSIQGTPNMGMPEGESLYHRTAKIDAVTMEAILIAERGSLTIGIYRAKQLVALDLNGRSDPFVTIHVDNSVQEKFKTKVIYRTLNPVWNERVTLALPQKHQKLTINIWDKDPFTHEKIGCVIFQYDELINLGVDSEGENKHWFNLQQTKSGEIQLGFKVELPQRLEDSHTLSTDSKENLDSFMYNSDDSDDLNYLVVNNNDLKGLKGSQSLLNLNGNLSNRGKEFATHSVDVSSTFPQIKENSEVVDFSGDPNKYYGLYGKVIEIFGLSLNADIDEVYVKVKLDRYAKFKQPIRSSILGKTERVLCRTSNFKVDEKIPIDVSFETNTNYGVSPCFYLILEIKSLKKGKDTIDSHSMLLRNVFKGSNPVNRIIQLDNGGKMKVELGHRKHEKF